MLKRESGITLIALVITIIVLLILAGISISILTGSGLFSEAERAKQEQENAQIKENTTLNEYKQWLANYTGEGLSGPQTPEQTEVTLASIVNVGDYVKYEPTPLTITDSEETTDVEYTELLDDLSKYSGSTDESYNNSSTIIQERNLNWRVLDKVKDENNNYCVRLISETPTQSQVRLYSYNGYNNAVYLIDNACNTLYNNSTYAKNVQNLKIEDIEKHMKIKPTLSETPVSPANLLYPSILEQEKDQIVTIGETTTNGTLELSKQTELIEQTAKNTADALSLKKTFWNQTMTEESFNEAIYNNLFIKDNSGSNYEKYWLSSRAVDCSSDIAYFVVRGVTSGNMRGTYMYGSTENTVGVNAFALRPVITLKADVLIDTEKSGDGTEVAEQYVLK